jgi:hypothetical protein
MKSNKNLKNPQPPKTPNLTPEEEKQIIKDIEKKTEQTIIDAYKTGKIVNPLLPHTETQLKQEMNTFEKILSTGANEFVSKTGRQLSYSEMREMFG